MPRNEDGKNATTLHDPHRPIEARNARERLALALFDALWSKYRERVAHVRAYEQLIASLGATFVNDHIAFRTIAAQRPMTGIATLSRIFEALGYSAAGCYTFPDKHLSSIHYQHPHPQFPKLFLSELRTWELDEDVRKRLLRTLSSHRKPVSESVLSDICHLGEDEDGTEFLDKLASVFERLPWDPPRRQDVVKVNEVTQFGAWVLLHGYAVNHFTALVNSHGVEALDDIEKTVAALRAAGVPMKAEIEGAPGSKLRQTATEAATVEVRVRDKGKVVEIPWTYAYFEIAERGDVRDPETGASARFEGFLGPQATQLFEMTRVESR